MVAACTAGKVTSVIKYLWSSVQTRIFHPTKITCYLKVTCRFVCDFTVQLILLVLNSANLAQVVLFITLASGFIAISNYLRVLIFAILLSFAEIAEINTRENMSPQGIIMVLTQKPSDPCQKPLL